MTQEYRRQGNRNMALDAATFFDNVIMTFLTVLTFILLILIFLYMIYGREETTATTTTAPKNKTLTINL